jgi:hypothetical protein
MSDAPVKVTLKFTPAGLIGKLAGFSKKLDATLRKAAWAGLGMAQEEIPPYPAANPWSSYRRTGDLGRSFGKSMSGGKIGLPDVYEVKSIGTMSYKGTIGSNSPYADYVVGLGQTYVHMGRWWTVESWAARVEAKIEDVYLRLIKLAIVEVGLG